MSAAATDGQRSFDRLAEIHGVDYALRTIQQSQVQFSMMADAKANIMITVCSIVISVSLTQIGRPGFMNPLLTLDVFTAVALVCSLLCVLPSRAYPRGADGRIDRKSSGFSPFLFFHTAHLTREEFEEEFVTRLSSPGSLYRTIAADIFGQAGILALRKYRFLRLSYLAFLTGLVSAGLVLVAQLVFGWPDVAELL